MATMDEELDDRDCLRRRLFALAGRRLEAAARSAGAGEGRDLSRTHVAGLADDLYLCGQDLLTIGDAITALSAEARP